MDFPTRVQVLQNLKTKELVEKLELLTDDLGKALSEEAKIREQYSGFTASSSQDCIEVKKLLAHLALDTPPLNAEGKKTTVADRESWLMGQRTENAELKAAIDKQHEAAVILENWHITIDMAHERLSNARAILNMKTAQINFLSRE